MPKQRPKAVIWDLDGTLSDDRARAHFVEVEQGKKRFVPGPWTNTYMAWMRNIHDWCISRQLWWGHQIPAWYCPDGHVTVAREAPATCGTCGKGGLFHGGLLHGGMGGAGGGYGGGYGYGPGYGGPAVMQGTLVIPYYPYVRSPRDFFMYEPGR